MKTRRSTRHALYAAIELAAARDGEMVTAADVAARHGLPPSVVAKVFQRLARAGFAAGTRGTSGGYRLARPAEGITVLELIEVFERIGQEPPPRAAQPPDAERRLRALFGEIDEQVRATFASVSLATLVAPRRPLVPAARSRRSG